MKKNILALTVSIIIAQSAGIVGSFFTISSIEGWYASLETPSFAPPDWLFAPAWITLYTLMATAAFLIWSFYVQAAPGELKKRMKTALRLYGIHLVFNALWSVIFFGLKNPGLAFLEILMLWLMILIVAWQFWQIRKIAAILLIPYLLWVSFAAVLNFAIWQLNV